MKNKITQNNNYSDRVIQALFQCIDQLFTHNKLQLIARHHSSTVQVTVDKMAVRLQEGMSVTLSYSTFQMRKENGRRSETIQCLSKEEAAGLFDDLLEYRAVCGSWCTSQVTT